MVKIDDRDYELWLLRYADGVLTDAERDAVEQWIGRHSDAARELALYNEAPRLKRNDSVRYTGMLPQRKQLLWPVLLRWSAAAAVVAALMLPVALMKQERAVTVHQVAQVKEIGMEKPAATPAIAKRQAPTAIPVDTTSIIISQSPTIILAEKHDEAIPIEEPAADPDVVYCDDLIVYEPHHDTVYTNMLIDYQNPQRSWTEDAREWIEDTRLARWLRRVTGGRAEMYAMNGNVEQ